MKYSSMVITAAVIAGLLMTSCSLLPGHSPAFESETTSATVTLEITTTSESGTEATTTSESSASETTTETTAETTTEVTFEETSETKASEVVTDACSFSPDRLMKAAKNNDAKVYSDIDKFIEDYKDISSLNNKALKRFKSGMAVVAEGSDINRLTNAIGNKQLQAVDVMSNTRKIGFYMCADVSSADSSYTVVLVAFETGDASVISDWFERSVKDYEDQLPDTYKNNEMFDLTNKKIDDAGISTFVSKFVINKDYSKKLGLSQQSGAFIATYAQSNHGMCLSVVNNGSSNKGIKLMDSLCKSMKIVNPQDVK